MSTGQTLVLFAALFIGLNPANADNIKFKYLLQCGNAKSVPPDSDTDLLREMGRRVAKERPLSGGPLRVDLWVQRGTYYQGYETP